MQSLRNYSDSSSSDDESGSFVKQGKLSQSKSRVDSSSRNDRYSTSKPGRYKQKRVHSRFRSRSRSPVKESDHDQRNQDCRSVNRLSEKDYGAQHETYMKAGQLKVSSTEPTSDCIKFPATTSTSKLELLKQKRKKLWSSKKETKLPSTNQWELATFSEGNEAQAKFRRLMGMGSSHAANKVETKEHSSTLERLEQQYESSRYLTHVARGVGLGFASMSEQNDIDK